MLMLLLWNEYFRKGHEYSHNMTLADSLGVEMYLLPGNPFISPSIPPRTPPPQVLSGMLSGKDLLSPILAYILIIFVRKEKAKRRERNVQDVAVICFAMISRNVSERKTCLQSRK